MRRLLIALVLAALILGVTIIFFLAFEPALGPAFAFWPGFVMQSLLEKLGFSVTNRVLPLVTLLFWWIAAWLVSAAVIGKRE